MVFNKQPIVSLGRTINVALYKDDKPILVKRSVGVGNCVQMKLTDSLYICCMEIVADGDDLMYSIAEFSPITRINLQNYPQGVDLIIQQNEITKSIHFSQKARS